MFVYLQLICEPHVYVYLCPVGDAASATARSSLLIVLHQFERTQ